MPEPPSSLSPAAQGRLRNTAGQIEAAGKAVTDLPAATETTRQARAAVEEPRAEQEAMAEAAAVERVDERPAPAASIEEACKRIQELIRSKRPPDKDSLVVADPRGKARQAGGQVNSDVQSRASSVQGGYQALDNPPEGVPSREPKPVEHPPAAVPTPTIDGDAGAPDPLDTAAVSLDSDVEQQKQSIDGAGMETEPAQLVEDGPIAEARAAAGELDSAAQSRPEQVLAEQTAAIEKARGDMRTLQQNASAALAQARAGSVNNIVRLSVDTTASEETQRTQAGTAIRAIFASAQTRVNDLLEPISETAIKRWDAGVERLSTQFEASLARVKQRVDERHENVLLSLWDSLIGLPDWATQGYDQAEKQFADGCCELARDISRDVEQIIETCEQIIEQARKDIDKYVDSLPDNLQRWASRQADQVNQQLDDLQNRVAKTQDGLNNDLVNRANQAVQEVRERVHALREEASGLIGRIQDAIDQFLENPGLFIVNGLLELVGIEPTRFWAMVDKLGHVIDGIAADPMKFANNMMTAVGQGFEQFFNRFPEHLLQGIVDWLFSKLGEAGVRLPKDFSLPSIITLFLEIMGITWARIRRLLARHIGEDNVALIEKAVELATVFIEKGPEGIFEMIKEQFNPQVILDAVIQAVKDYVMEALISRVTARILALFNPAGAILQAIEAIYRVLKWIFENAAKIFTLVETLVNGAADILAGNTGGLANAVEAALAGLIAPVIGFLADYIGLGGIPEAIRDAVLGLQQRVEDILDRVIGFLADKAKQLLKAVGLGGQQEDSSASEFEKEFQDIDGSPHELTITLVGNRPDIRVASNDATGVQHQIDDRRRAAKDNSAPLSPTQEAALTTAWTQHERLVGLARQYMAADAQQKQDLAAEIKQIMDLLATNMVEGDAWPDEDVEPTHVEFSESGGKKTVIAKPLTRRPGNTVGSAAADVLPGWRKNVGQQSSGRGGNLTWKRVHLLADKLHGPGNEPANLIPGDETTNGAMRRGPEKLAYERITRGETLEYTARVKGLDPNNSFFPQSPQGVHVTVKKTAPGETETVFDAPIQTRAAPTASLSPQLTPTQKSVVDAYELLRIKLGRKPTQIQIAEHLGIKSRGNISVAISQIRELVGEAPRPLTGELKNAAEVLQLKP